MSSGIKRRVGKLELIRPAFRKCPSCGDIDPATRSGPLRQAIMLDQPDGRYTCICKGCCRCFSALMSNDERCAYIVSDVTPCAFPI